MKCFINKTIEQGRVRDYAALGCAIAMIAIAAGTGCNKNDEKNDEKDATASTTAMTTDKPSAPAANGSEQEVAIDADSVVVDVDGVQLKRSEMQRQLARVMASQGMQGMGSQFMSPEVMKRFESQVVERFIAQHVLINEAVRQKHTAEESEIAEAIEDIKKGLPESITLEMALSQHGMTEADFRKDVANDLRIRKLIDDVTKTITVPTDDEIKKFYDESPQRFEVGARAKTRHILVECREGESEEKHAEKRKEAEAILDQLKEGVDFAKLAEEKSTCPSGKKGGDLGYVEQGQMVKPFEEAVFAQPLKTAGPIVKTQFGYHIIEVLDRTEKQTQVLEEVRDQIASYLKDRKHQEIIESFIEDLKTKAKIQYENNADATGNKKENPS